MVVMVAEGYKDGKVVCTDQRMPSRRSTKLRLYVDEMGKPLVADGSDFVVVTARKGTVSHKSALERLPEELTRFFSGTNLMIIFPDQHGDSSGNVLTFAEPQHQEEISAYVAFNQWFKKKFRNIDYLLSPL